MSGHFGGSSRGQPSDKDDPQQRSSMARRGPRMMRNVEKAKDAKGILRRLLSYLGEYRILLIMVTVLTVASALLNLAGPYLQGVAIDQFILTGDREGLVRIITILAGTYVAGTIASMGAGWVMADISQRSLMKLRKELFEHMETLSLSFFDKRPTGDLMSRLTNDIDAIGTALSQNVTQLIQNSITLVGILVMMFSLNVRLALASLIVFPIMVVLTALVGGKTRESFRGLQMNLGMLNGTMQETISGQRVVIAFDQQESVNRKFTKLNTEVRDLGIKAMTYAMLIPPLMGILSNANIAIVAGIGAYMVIKGMATVGIIATFITYSRRFADPLRHFANLYNSIQSALAGAERIFEVIDTEPELTDAEDAISVYELEGEVVFDEVDFGYVPEVQVLKHITLKAKKGQTIALVGPTGAGKTTMVNVLTRFYDIQDGSITIDGMNIKQIKKDDLRRQLGIVLQDVFLFSGTVMDNIKYGNLEATEEDCIAAAKLANADGFIRRLPQGYETNLSERATNLSQGQRQLLSIARAIVADPSILILDEATSSVDTRTEIQIQQALLNLMEGRTAFVIAHRLSTIRNADMVLVINDGKIIERGTHTQLLEKKGFYYNLYMSQFKGTKDDVDFEYIKPVERPEPMMQPQGMMGRRGMRGMGGGMHGGMRPSPAMMQERMMQIAETFKEKGAVSPETALSIEELGLPPMFEMMQMNMGQSSAFLEHNGKFYLSEEKLGKM
ncbi:MAG: ABC transporter ATP-binding protein/permease [Candidatus Bathyarchaeota archaeon]|nr:ABC transporter ATP-binding protein/permease [Candidatus Bathyarchaeota archaeon]